MEWNGEDSKNIMAFLVLFSFGLNSDCCKCDNSYAPALGGACPIKTKRLSFCTADKLQGCHMLAR